jgi:hypothetical protein
MAIDTDGNFGYKPLLDAIFAALVDMVDDGFIRADELLRMVIPTVGRNKNDLPSMAVDDPPNGRESYSSAFKLFREMQTLKHAEQFIDILHVETCAIIPYENLYFIFPIHTTNLDFRLRSHACEFDRIGEKVDDHQPQHGTIAVTHRKGIDLPHNISPAGGLPDLRDDLFDELVRRAPSSVVMIR